MCQGKYGYPVSSDKTIDDVNGAMFDALIIPGGCTLLLVGLVHTR